MALALVDLLGAVGNICAIVYFVVPALIIYEMIQTHESNKVPYMVFVSTIMNCLSWTAYGIRLGFWPIYLCNSLGIIANSVYLSIFFLHLDIAKFKKFVLLTTSILLIVFIFAWLYSWENVKLVGMVACLINTVMLITPLQKSAEVYKYQDNSFIPIHLTLVNVLSTTVWTLYGFSNNFNMFVMIPNFTGFCFSIFSIYLWNKFRKVEASELRQNFEILQVEGKRELLLI